MQKKKKQLPARHGGEAEFRRWTARAMASTDKRQLNHNTYNYVIVMVLLQLTLLFRAWMHAEIVA